MELTKTDSKMLQGLSVLAMVWLHLFDTFDYVGKFTPLVFVWGAHLSFYFAQLSDFCVFGFAFLSGYAHMLQSSQADYYRHRLKGLLSLMCSYWVILVVFSLISILLGQATYMPGSAGKFIRAVFLLDSYNGAWWYLRTYATLVIISPIVLKWVKQSNPIVVLGIGFAVYCLSYYVRFNLDHSSWLLGQLGPFGMTLFEYLLGALALKYQVFTHIYKIWEKFPKAARWLLAVVLMLGMLYGRTKVVPSLFVAPVTGFVVMTLFHFWNKPQIVQDFFVFIGNHSTNIWLTHMFFYLYLFRGLVYKAKYPIFIFAFMLVLTVSLSMLLKAIENPIQMRIRKR